MRDPSPLPPEDYLHHAAARRIIVGILLTMLLAALDQVMVATALPTIAASLGDLENLSWVVTANLLCATAATPLYGKLSDIHGRRTMLLIAIGVYAAGSLCCALAPTMLALIFGRALQGLGGGGLMPLVQTIIGDVASPRDRPRYQTYTSSTFIVSTVAGPLLAGFIAQHFHWTWIFWLNLPLCALAYVLTHNVLQRLPRHERPHQLDVLGALLMLGAAIPLMLALNWGGRRYAWSSPALMTLFAVSAALWASPPLSPVPLIVSPPSSSGLAPLVAAPHGFSPAAALILIALVGLGLGPTFPFTVVVVQNAVALHDLGIATGAMNFFRALGATFLVALFGAILVAGAPMISGMSAGTVLAAGAAAGTFRLIFAVAMLCLAIALASILALDERPLRGANAASSAA
jgi:MFS family permease